MDLQKLTKFFLWCTILNAGLLILWAVMLVTAMDWVYGLQTAFFPIPRDIFPIVMYAFIGFYKSLVLVFNVIPLVALLIVK
ncbi:MAG: hypothetical protein HUU16_11165 [Candidatus Omnitrophica bacterium]|nr:hypothetical protein [Candidatus Omnitrophota bacterium]